MSDVQSRVWMTPEVVERLTKELQDLNTSRTHRLAEGATVDARIREIERLLRDAEVDSKPDDGLVEPGMRVTVRFDSDGSTDTFLIAARELLTSDPSITIDVYSPASPLGAAIVGKYIGETTSYLLPNGTSATVEILAAIPFAR